MSSSKKSKSLRTYSGKKSRRKLRKRGKEKDLGNAEREPSVSPVIQSTLDQWAFRDFKTPAKSPKKAPRRIWFASSFSTKESDGLAARIGKTGSKESSTAPLSDSPTAVISLRRSSDIDVQFPLSTPPREPDIDDKKPAATESDATPRTPKAKKRSKKKKRKSARSPSDEPLYDIASPDRPLGLSEEPSTPTPGKSPKLDREHSVTNFAASPYGAEANADILASGVKLEECATIGTHLDEPLHNIPERLKFKMSVKDRAPTPFEAEYGFQSHLPIESDTTPLSAKKMKKRKRTKSSSLQSPDSQARSWSQEMKASLTKKRKLLKTPPHAWKLPSQPIPIVPKSPTLGQKRLALFGIDKNRDKKATIFQASPVVKSSMMAPSPMMPKAQLLATGTVRSHIRPVAKHKVHVDETEQSSPASSLSSIVVTIPEGDFSDYDPQSDWDAESESGHSLPSLSDSLAADDESDEDEDEWWS